MPHASRLMPNSYGEEYEEYEESESIGIIESIGGSKGADS